MVILDKSQKKKEMTIRLSYLLWGIHAEKTRKTVFAQTYLWPPYKLVIDWKLLGCGGTAR